MKIIKREGTLKLIDFPGFIDAAETAFKSFAEGKASPPAYINMEVNGQFVHYKSGYRKGSKYFTMKYSGLFWDNAKKELPVDYGYVVAHLAETGEPVVMFQDLGAITDYRTAAAGTLTSKLLSRTDSKIVGVIGTGVQARLQIEALLEVRPRVEMVKVWGRTQEHLNEYIDEMSAKFPGLKFSLCKKAEDVVRDVDILITVSASDSPIVKADWIAEGTHICAVGACTPTMQEHYPEVLELADKLYVDSIEKASCDGELHHALESKVMSKEQVTGELGQLILGHVPGREGSKEITFVDLVGLGIQDASAVEYMLTRLSV